MNKSINRKTKETLFKNALPCIMTVTDLEYYRSSGFSDILDAIEFEDSSFEENILQTYFTLGAIYAGMAEAYTTCFKELNILDEFEKWGRKNSNMEDALMAACEALTDLYEKTINDEEFIDFPMELDDDEFSEEAYRELLKKIAPKSLDEEAALDEDFFVPKSKSRKK